MAEKKKKKKKRRIVLKVLLGLLIILLIGFLWIFVPPRVSLIGKSTDHKVYVSFGFHTNLYHSFRIDTNDEAGFGKDIRVIRNTIDILDSYNEKGVPVQAVWDIENLFSLQETLPEYAPDIIEDIQRRVNEGKDEVIIMSYNNGLTSAFNEEEFDISVEKAIRNEHNSGVEDIFKKWTPIVRPQEMMATQGNFNLYKKHGIDAIALYYSAIPFDAMRVFIRELSLEEAHNPLTYKDPNTKEEIVVIPCYNIGDLIENVSLRRWVRQLHREQLRGNIKRDVLIFINFDADDEFWYGYDFPSYLSWLPNTGGLGQVIDSVDELDYVEFTTVGEYLKNNDPAGEICFGQDTADGSFCGYTSWTEKSYSHEYWTEVDKDRRIHNYIDELYKLLGKPIPAEVQTNLEGSMEKRVRLQSTTNFGMATPFLARARERVVEGIIEEKNNYSDKAEKKAKEDARTYMSNTASLPDISHTKEIIDTYIILNTNDETEVENRGRFLTFIIRDVDFWDKQYSLYNEADKEIRCYFVGYRETDTEGTYEVKLYVPPETELKDGIYSLVISPNQDKTTSSPVKAEKQDDKTVLTNGIVTVNISKSGKVSEVLYKGEKQLDENSITPMINYNNNIHRPEEFKVNILDEGTYGVASIELETMFELPVENLIPGGTTYRLTLIEDVPYLFVDGIITYPNTERKDVIKAEMPSLIRKVDDSWIEVAPIELHFTHKANLDRPFKVLKENYLGVEASYEIDYHRHSKRNLNIANINNHITPEYAALTNGYKGIAVGMDTAVMSNFAFCPMKQSYDKSKKRFSIKLNPFGTYYGEQYYPPTWGHRQGFRSSFLTGQQYSSSASTYNGVRQSYSLMLTFFDGDSIPEEIKSDLSSFAHAPVIIAKNEIIVEEYVEESTLFPPMGFIASYSENGVYFHWEKIPGSPQKFIIHCGTEKGSYEQSYVVDGDKTTAIIEEYTEGQKFEEGKTYYAQIGGVSQSGVEGLKSKEISFTAKLVEKGSSSPKIPLDLQLKIFLHTLKSFID
jgi:hypothetical protein